MVNKCVVVGCAHGYRKRKCDSDNADVLCIKKASFHFPKNNDSLYQKWIRFISRKDWKPTENSVICCDHFEPQFLKYGKRTKLNWELDPIPTIYPEEFTPTATGATTSSTSTTRNPPKIRSVPIPGEYEEFLKRDV